MIREKTAKKRETAVLQATKPFYDKLGNGLDYIRREVEEIGRRQEGYNTAIGRAVEEVRELQLEAHISSNSAIENTQRRLDTIDGLIQSGRSDMELMMSEMNIKCKECGAFMAPVQVVCHKCGAFSHIFPYNINEAEKISHMIASGVAPMSKKLKAYSCDKAPYKELQKEFDAMCKIKSVAELYCENKDSGLHKASFEKIVSEANKFLDEAKKKAIEIAVVGNVKAGKSMLINALLGDKMASVDATPETSVLVKYRTTSDKYYTKVSFYTAEQWNALFESAFGTTFEKKYSKSKADNIKEQYLDKESVYIEYESKKELIDAIMKWTSSETKEHFFVSEVEVGFISNDFPHDVVLVDTPGLQDTVKFRSNITRDYIKNAHWVLACIMIKNLSSENEIKFLAQVKANLQHDMKRMFIVATQADLETSETNRQKIQSEFLQGISTLYKDDISNNKENIIASIRDNFIPVSAQGHWLYKKCLAGEELSKDENKSLKQIEIAFDIESHNLEMDTDAIFDKFKINTLFNKLQDKVIKKRRSEIITMIKKDYEKAYINIGIEAKNIGRISGQELLELHDESDNYFEEMKEMKNECDEVLEQISELKTFLNETCNKLKGGE